MEQGYLSNTELYYAYPENTRGSKILLLYEEVHHIIKVMRHRVGDRIYITSGEGTIWKCTIEGIERKQILCGIDKEIKFEKENKNICFCLPLMKSNDRLEFAIEKLVEQGINRFLIYSSGMGSSRSAKLDRLEKIALAAMKQSLRAYLPSIEYINSLSAIFMKSVSHVVFDQAADKSLLSFLNSDFENEKEYYFVIGPEAGFSDKENELFDDATLLKLTDNRLRSETAAITAGAIITTSLLK
ncbi:MAG: 16S rRNA (uracil(1498)-N(3))-methyltransferase [Bacteroidetes bacterium]|nr:16S rRNA (uracil(1498)-N(3))-methyltransferase [Bacteroidota bacterium]